MRGLSAFDEIPTHAQLRERIPDQDRFRPPLRVLQRARLAARDDGYIDIILPGAAPRRVHPMVAEAHRAMEEGLSFDEVVARASPLWRDGNRTKLVSSLLRSYTMRLADHGYLTIPFEEPPTSFLDRFDRVKILGRGGMGIVHLCNDRIAGGLVAVKHAWGWTRAIERTERVNRVEAVALGLLDHPLVPGLVTTFEERGLLHLVRRFAPGLPLGRKRAAQLTPEARLRVARDMCAAIAHIHERGMLYLDVKPDNFIVGDDGRARLIDLGLARPGGAEGIALRGAIGTRGYVAPEIVRTKRASERSDVFSIGRTLYFLAMQERPRAKHTATNLRAAMLERGIGHAEAELIAWMGADDPAARAPTVADAMDRIDEILAQTEPRTDVVPV